MRKIFLWIILLFLIFIWGNVFANTRTAQQIDQEIQSKKEQLSKTPQDSISTRLRQEISDLEAEKETLSSSSSTSWCTYSEWSSLSSFLDGCKPEKVVSGGNMSIEGWFKTKINTWIQNLALVLWVAAVASLVYAALLFQFANGEDEKIKKAKDIVKWTLIWFLLLISSGGIVYVVINVMFGLWEL